MDKAHFSYTRNTPDGPVGWDAFKPEVLNGDRIQGNTPTATVKDEIKRIRKGFQACPHQYDAPGKLREIAPGEKTGRGYELLLGNGRKG